MTQAEAANETGQLRLQGGGGYNKTIAISSNALPNPAPDDTVDVHFENVPPGDKYTLTYIASDGTETAIVQDAPYSSLNDNSLPEGGDSGSSPAPTPNPRP
jgi:hypothetical protein